MQTYKKMTVISSMIALIVCFWIFAAIGSASVISCPPNSVQQEWNPKLAQLCNAIEKAISETDSDGSLPRMGDERKSNFNIKRQDVDHVFLRFGRRLGQ